MPTYDGRIENLVIGDSITITRTIEKLPASSLLTAAKFTVKKDPTSVDPGLIQKSITTTDNPGVGQITDDGTTQPDGTVTATVRFDLVPVDTRLLDPEVVWWYDIQVCTDAGKTYTPEIGDPAKGGGIQSQQDVTITVCS